MRLRSRGPCVSETVTAALRRQHRDQVSNPAVMRAAVDGDVILKQRGRLSVGHGRLDTLSVRPSVNCSPPQSRSLRSSSVSARTANRMTSTTVSTVRRRSFSARRSRVSSWPRPRAAAFPGRPLAGGATVVGRVADGQNHVGDRVVVESAQLRRQLESPPGDRPRPSNGNRRSSRSATSQRPLASTAPLMMIDSVAARSSVKRRSFGPIRGMPSPRPLPSLTSERWGSRSATG